MVANAGNSMDATKTDAYSGLIWQPMDPSYLEACSLLYCALCKKV